MLTPVLHDPSVDPDDDQGMPDAEDHQEVGARRGRLDARYQMELGDQLGALIVEAGIKPTNYRDIKAYGSYYRCGEACRVTCTS